MVVESPQALSPGLVNRLAKEVGKTATGWSVVGRNSQRRGFREEMWVVDGWVESFGHPYWGGIKPIQIYYMYNIYIYYISIYICFIYILSDLPIIMRLGWYYGGP